MIRARRSAAAAAHAAVSCEQRAMKACMSRTIGTSIQYPPGGSPTLQYHRPHQWLWHLDAIMPSFYNDQLRWNRGIRLIHIHKHFNSSIYYNRDNNRIKSFQPVPGPKLNCVQIYDQMVSNPFHVIPSADVTILVMWHGQMSQTWIYEYIGINAI